ncbi:MAG: heparinase II/III-family protein, partial [Prevotellaceae bacterium]|nr:heparinase II/III-family protein [Prevotellaceae bacterium]
MKRLIILLSAISLSAFNIYAYEERNLLQKAVTLDALKEMLILNQKWVSFPNYTDRAEWDALLGDSKDAYIKQAEKYLTYQWQVVKASDYLEYERSGDRKFMEAPFNDNNYAISTLLLAELAEGKGRFIDQIINGVYLSCEMTSWVLAAHLHAQHSKRALPDYREHVIDLTSGDLSSILAWTYYFLHGEFDKVDPVISKRLYKELKERTMDTYMNEDRFWWMAFDLKPGATVNNWNPWCNSNVLQTFLLLENDRDKLAEAVYRTMASTDKFINYAKADGACEEGPSYWGHAAGKLYDYLQILYDATGKKVSLFKEPLIKDMGEYISRSYVGNGWVINFADASAKGGGGAPLIYRYGKAVNSTEMMGYAAHLEKIKSGSLLPERDIYRALQNMLHTRDFKIQSAFHNPPAHTWYPLTEFCYMKNDNGFFLATKGGYNNESHNHNDVGTFSLYLNTTPIFIDAGVGTYTRQTFSSERYTIWTMQSNY